MLCILYIPCHALSLTAVITSFTKVANGQRERESMCCVQLYVDIKFKSSETVKKNGDIVADIGNNGTKDSQERSHNFKQACVTNKVKLVKMTIRVRTIDQSRRCPVR